MYQEFFMKYRKEHPEATYNKEEREAFNKATNNQTDLAEMSDWDVERLIERLKQQNVFKEKFEKELEKRAL